MYTMDMLSNPPSTVWRGYFNVIDFTKKFHDEKTCENYLISKKYPEGFICKKCQCRKYYRINGKRFKRNRILQCADCGKQESITANTIFHGSKLPLLKWFWAFYFISQTKKGISGCRLSRRINVSESTALLILYKIRKEMEENVIEYQIGGPDNFVETDEIEIGGKGKKKQKILVLLEKNKINGKIGRIRFAPITDKSLKSIELNLIPMIKVGTTLHVDGNKVYSSLAIRYFRRLTINQIAHWEENYSHEFLNDLNTIVSNFKAWYKGTHHQFAFKNTAYYLNEFAYRFNRRRSEKNIFDRLLTRSIQRPKILKSSQLYVKKQYLPLAS